MNSRQKKKAYAKVDRMLAGDKGAALTLSDKRYLTRNLPPHLRQYVHQSFQAMFNVIKAMSDAVGAVKVETF
jgi:hypothetical protein